MKLKTSKKVLGIIGILLVVICVASLIAIKIMTYHNEDEFWNTSTDQVSVIVNKDVIFYDGPGTSEALIFYPGGFVDFDSYSELLKAIAQRGIDCFSIRMPLNFAFFGVNKADKILSSYDYDNWYIGGHSLGGVVACKFASDNYSRIKGVVLFASYSVYNLIDKGLKVVSIYGSNDQVLNREEYEKRRVYLPQEFYELVIVGGNHCQFGNYGFQKGDGLATISNQEQINTAADFLQRNK